LERLPANAALAMVWGLGGIAGPGVTGMAMDIWDPHGMVVVLVVACVAALAGMYALRRGGRCTGRVVV